MARTITKSGSKVKVNCPICGKVFTKAGMVGHIRWKHGKDHKATLLSVEKPYPVSEARRKAKLYDEVKLFEHIDKPLLDLLLDDMAPPEALQAANALLALSEATALGESSPKRMFSFLKLNGRLFLAKEDMPYVEIIKFKANKADNQGTTDGKTGANNR